MSIFGYCRISHKTQSIDRQVRNITEEYPSAYIIKEAFTGTKIKGRKKLDKLIKAVRPGDTIVFDSASRMSRNAEEAMRLYEELFDRGVSLVFLKEPHINTDVYRNAMERHVDVNLNTGSNATDDFIKSIISSLNIYTRALAKDQIRIVFDQAEKEVEDLHRRTAEGMLTARLNGKQIGRAKGETFTTKKSVEAKKAIRKYSQDFDGSLKDPDVIKLAGISRGSYYKYKREIREEIAGV